MSRSRGAALGLAVLLAATTLVGCGDGGGGGDDDGERSLDLDGHSYTSTEVRGRTLVTGTTVTLSFEDDRISAQAGCNTLTGTATWTDGTFATTGPLASTRMACEKGLTAQDEWLSDFLTSQPAIALEEDTLTLGNDRNGMTLTEDS